MLTAKHIGASYIVAPTLLAILGGAVLYEQGQDKYSLKSPNGVAFSP